MSEQGERGQSGDRGIAGERGPKGDHGQQGDQGDLGAKGDRGAIGDQGPYGPKGERGPLGDPGPHGERGVTGDLGLVGPKGERGEQGRIPPKITLSFAVITIVAFLVLLFAAYQAKKSSDTANAARTLAMKVQQQAATIQQLRSTQFASCRNFTILENAVNDLHGTFRSLLLSARVTDRRRAAAAQNKATRDANLKQIRDLDRLIAKVHVVNATCAQRPVDG